MKKKRYSSLGLPTIMLSFGAATGAFDRAMAQEPPTPPLPPPNPVTLTQDTVTQPVRTYWKHPEYDAVLEVWTDPEKGLRGRLASLNPDDPKIKLMVSRILEKKPEKVTQDDILGFVGMEGDLKLRKLGDNHWKGSMFWPFKGKSYGVEVKQEDDNLYVRGFILKLPILGRSVDLKPSPPPAPKP